MTTDARTRGDPPPKATLFCPDCGHRSRFDGDWRIEESGGTTRYLCPDCRTEVSTRPSFGDDATRPDPMKYWGRIHRAWARSLRLWLVVSIRGLLRP